MLHASLSGRLAVLLALVPVLVAGAACHQKPTPEEAALFAGEAEERLLDLWIQAERASWVQRNFITGDTELMAAEAYAELLAATGELAKEATRFDGLELSEDLARKLRLLKTSLPLASPSDPALQKELSELSPSMQGLYSTGEYCPDWSEECLNLGEISSILAESRDPERLLDLWVGWRTVSPPMRETYRRFAELGSAGARELGFADLGALWRSGYDMPPDDFAREVERLWKQVEPLYDSLHRYVRARLNERYGDRVVPRSGPIPAHLLGNMWAQSWLNIYDLVAPPAGDPGYDLTELLEERGVDPLEMVRFGESFFVSLGFDPLPETFWDRSLFVRPADRDVVCHASAWNIDWEADLRLKMCIEVNAEDFVTVHHELGHNYYQWAYSKQPPLFRNSANDGFHEGIGDTLALSITPDYLMKVGLLDELPAGEGELGQLMNLALDKVAFLPFAMVVDQWRWKVFSGEIPPERYNEGWWELRERYQKVAAPVPRSEADFDPGAKYHVPFNTPYTRYFLAAILQFQFHRALCREAGYEGPLHRCSIYANQAAGKRLMDMLEMGMSRPWPDALEALTGEREMDATAILDYFEPLQEWLDEESAR